MPVHAGRIDVHHHFVPDWLSEGLQADHPQVRGGMSFPSWTAERAIALMDANGIGAAILSANPLLDLIDGHQTEAASNARRVNESIAGVIEAFPGRFGGFALLPVFQPGAALLELEHAIGTLGLDGVGLPASAGVHYLGAAFFDPLFVELNRLRAVVHVHPWTPADCGRLTPSVPEPMIEFMFDTTRAVANLFATGALERYPDIRFIFPHAGGTVPFLAARMARYDGSPAIRDAAPLGALTYLRRLYYDTALTTSHPALRALFELVEPSHVLFGTDWPFAPSRVTAESVEQLSAFDGIDAAAQDLISRGNALALFPRLAGAG